MEYTVCYGRAAAYTVDSATAAVCRVVADCAVCDIERTVTFFSPAIDSAASAVCRIVVDNTVGNSKIAVFAVECTAITTC